ncbi:MAG TPA: Gfo/Idh/MocA family oxidoreductase, partial [Ohtaekwangia sp.]|nr:Gfo/Idh/MocA family oxidoreductase [Ohtaekwangia sp.]
MDKPVSTALLSYGMSGEVFHAPLLASIPEFKLSAIVQRKGDKAKSHFPDARIYRTIEEVINDPEIELVIVNTPNETHVEFAANALEAGKHVV